MVLKQQSIRLETSQLDPTRVLYNALVPFALAAVEHFFSQSFKILLKYDENAQMCLLKHQRKLEIGDVVAIRDGFKTLEDVVASWYSFQSIASIHAAYKEWLSIDFWAVLRRRRKVGIRLPVLERQLDHLIEFRHGVVHRFDIDSEFPPSNRICTSLKTAWKLAALFKVSPEKFI